MNRFSTSALISAQSLLAAIMTFEKRPLLGIEQFDREKI
jgi:hypothetical protein